MCVTYRATVWCYQQRCCVLIYRYYGCSISSSEAVLCSHDVQGRGCSELVMSVEIVAKIGSLATYKQVLVVKNLLFGQFLVLQE